MSAIHALRCRLPFPGSDLLTDMWEGDVHGLATRPAHGSVAYLVRVADLGSLRAAGDAFIDRKRKHPAKALAALLLGQPRVPFIAGSFRSDGQLIRSVRTLLDGAAKRHDKNAYVIGIDDRLFDLVAARSRETSSGGALWQAAAGSPQPLVSIAGDEHAFSFSEYVNLLEPQDIPDELTERLVGNSPEIDLVRQWIMLATRHADPVLILGDTGTGKEVAARAIHYLDPERGKHGFVAVNCGAISPELFESELFGYAPGAFTDARRDGKPGLWSFAGPGTLFLDEIADLKLSHQVKILRAIEEHTVRRVGATEEEPVHCRVIAATNRDLFAMVQAGEFREDLYYRLGFTVVRMPRLRDHPQDVSVLAEYFWEKEASGRDPLSTATLAALSRYRWPGNARELRAVLISLARMFPTVPPRVEHVRAVFQMQSSTRIDEETLGVADEARMHRGECLRHLRRADEAVRTIKVLLGPFGSGRVSDDGVRRVRAAVAHSIADLQVLFAQPLLFHSISTFDVVHRLAGGLMTLQNLLAQSTEKAQHFWKRELAGEVASALSVIMREVERLLKKL